MTSSTTCSIVSSTAVHNSIPSSLTDDLTYTVKGIADHFLIASLAAGITIPDTVEEIIPSPKSESYSPNDWACLQNSLTIPRSITRIHADAFSDCPNIATLRFAEGQQLTRLDGFQNCTTLVTVELPPSLKIIADTCFFQCKILKNINLAQCPRLREIHGFQRCYSLDLIQIPPSVEIIGKTGFKNCSRLTRFVDHWGMSEDAGSDVSDDDMIYEPLDIEFADSGQLKEISGFNDCLIADLTIPDSVERINGFNGRTSWSEYDRHTDCLGVARVHFGEKSRLREIHGFSPPCMSTIRLPDSLEIIGKTAFQYSSDNHKCYFIPYGPPLQTIEFGPNSHLREIHGIRGCPYLSQIYLPDSVTQIGPQSFEWCNKPLLGGNQKKFFLYVSQDSQLHEIVIRFHDREFKLVVMGESWNKGGNLWQYIESRMSDDVQCRCLASVLVVPDFVATIPERAFVECPELKTVIFQPGSRIAVIDGFRFCPKLQEIVCPGSIREIGGFLDCPKMKLVKFLGSAHIPKISGFHPSYNSDKRKRNRRRILCDYDDIRLKRKSLQIALSATNSKPKA